MHTVCAVVRGRTLCRASKALCHSAPRSPHPQALSRHRIFVAIRGRKISIATENFKKSVATENSLSRQNSSTAHVGARPSHHLIATQFLCRATRPPSLDHMLLRLRPRLRHITKRTLSLPKPPCPSPKPCHDMKIPSQHGTESLCCAHVPTAPASLSCAPLPSRAPGR